MTVWLFVVAISPPKTGTEAERRAADVIEAITHTGLRYDEGEETIAIQEMRMEPEQKKTREAAWKLVRNGTWY